MKKLWYLLPLVLLGLSASPVTLYKEKVDFLLSKNPSAQVSGADALTKLSPGYWKLRTYDVSATTNFSNLTFSSDGTSSVTNNTQPASTNPEPIYQGATFRGFPVAAYFSKSGKSQSGNVSSSYDASGYSYLGIGVDLFLVILSLIFAIWLNRRSNPLKAPEFPMPAAAASMPTLPPSLAAPLPQPPIVVPVAQASVSAGAAVIAPGSAPPAPAPVAPVATVQPPPDLNAVAPASPATTAQGPASTTPAPGQVISPH